MIAGEAANKIDRTFQETHLTLDWKGIISFRHVVVHGYDRIDLPTVWQIVTDDVIKAKAALEKLPEYQAAVKENKIAEENTKNDFERYGLTL